MGNGFHLRERQGADCGFHNRYLTTLFRTLFVHCPEHFQSHHGGPVLAENNIVNVILFVALINKECSQSLTGDLDRSDDRLELSRIDILEAQSLQIDILLRG